MASTKNSENKPFYQEALNALIEDFDRNRDPDVLASTPYLYGRKVAVMHAIFRSYHHNRKTGVHKEAKYMKAVEQPRMVAMLLKETSQQLDHLRKTTKSSQICWDQVLEHIDSQSMGVVPAFWVNMDQRLQAFSGFSQQNAMNKQVLGILARGPQ